MIKAKKILKNKKSNILKTNNFPKITGIVYKLKGEISEDLFVAYDKKCDCLRYVGDDLYYSLKKIKTKAKFNLELQGYRSLHDNDYKKPMKPVFFSDDYTEEDISKLNKYKF